MVRRSLVCKGDLHIDHKLRKFLTSLHIIEMGCKGVAKGIEPLCEALKLTERKLRYYLLDSGALKIIKSSIMNNKLKKSDIEDQKLVLETLEENGIFVWFAYIHGIVEKIDKLPHLANYGILEDALLEFCNTHDRTHHEQNNRDCTLDNCEKMDIFLKQLGKTNADHKNLKTNKPFD